MRCPAFSSRTSGGRLSVHYRLADPAVVPQLSARRRRHRERARTSRDGRKGSARAAPARRRAQRHGVDCPGASRSARSNRARRFLRRRRPNRRRCVSRAARGTTGKRSPSIVGRRQRRCRHDGRRVQCCRSGRRARSPRGDASSTARVVALSQRFRALPVLGRLRLLSP